MNRALVKRLINDYLDGEIGLADKAELERLMAEDPQVRAEYKALRQIGLQLSGMPEIVPHPQRLRSRVQEALTAQRRVLLPPQKLFAGAMAVALVVIGVSFGMLVFQEKMLGGPVSVPAMSVEASQPTIDPSQAVAVLDTGCDADRFFSRLLLENQLGMVDSHVLASIVSQTNVLEGAACTTDSLNGVKLAYPLPVLQLHVAPSVAQQLSRVAEEVAGRSCPLEVTTSASRHVFTFEQYLRRSPAQQNVNLLIKFR